MYYSLTTDCLVATGRTSVAFRARANNDLHIALASEDSITSGTHYEFIIGGWANSRSEIRYGISSTVCDSYSGSVLTQTYFEEFWISWIGNEIRFGTGSTPGSNIRMSCYHSTPYDVNFIWIETGWGSSGEWRFPNGNINSQNHMVFSSRYILMKINAYHKCFIFFVWSRCCLQTCY